MDSFPSFANLPKRHYKKDSRFVNDLYTLTYDDHESVDTVELISVFNKRKRNDREEIRRRLAMGAEDDYFSRLQSDKPGRKPSLHSRLQGGMNLQICFMNETASDTESPSSDSESCPKLSKSITFSNHSASTANGDNGRNYNGGSTEGAQFNTRSISVNNGIAYNKKNSNERVRPTSLPIGPAAQYPYDDSKDIDFFTIQARLQIEARMALAQAKDMAHMQMEVDRQRQQQSPITAIIRNSLEKVGIPLSPEKRRVSRQMLTNMNIAQLQIIVNELHTEFERLSEYLVKYLLDRDDLHMSQDSKLVDIEDLTRYLGAKEQGIDYPSGCNLLEQHQQAQQQSSVATIRTTTTSATAATIPERPVSTTLQIRKEPVQFYNNIKNIDNNDIMKRINASTTTISTTNKTSTKPQTQNKLLRIASLVKK